MVPYLNVQPLIWQLQKHGKPDNVALKIRAARPRQLAQELAQGAHDAAIVPVFEYMLRPEFYTIVPGVSIASRAEVYSVMLFAASSLEQVRRVYLDSGSLTSINLLRVLMAERGLKPEYMDSAVAQWQPGDTLNNTEAALLIGDPAMHERGRHPYQFDLGLLWQRQTGLPFVFAAWLVHPSARERPINGILQTAKEYGLHNLESIARDVAFEYGSTPADTLRYFRENLCYELGERELAGWRKFSELCVKHRLINVSPEFRMHEH
ncbi:MAG: menaquinone biosynthetic enzyme MqnA/MqnD family protein [Candidatus Sumerlaeaceae bacterium]